jgi:general secretion pathway protein F
MESSAELRRSIRSALAYPLLLAGAGIASMVLLVGFVLPRFAAILTDLGQQLPRSTRLVLAAAEAAKVGFLPATLVAAIFAVVWRLWTGTVAGEERWHEFLLSLPFLGSIRRSAAASRVAAALSALLESGVPIAPALGHAARAGGDAALSKRILASRDAVVSGASLARSLEAEHATTATMLRLIRAGEATGRLASMLARAAQLEAERTAQLMKSAVRVLEPGMILLFGVGVGLIAAALLQAVYSVRPGL